MDLVALKPEYVKLVEKVRMEDQGGVAGERIGGGYDPNTLCACTTFPKHTMCMYDIPNKFIGKIKKGRECGSLPQHVLSMHKALGSGPNPHIRSTDMSTCIWIP